MTLIDEILAANIHYASSCRDPVGGVPSRHLAVVTCMDTRIDVLAALGLEVGQAHVIRNAGGRVTDDVLRSLALSCQVLGVTTLVLMQHTKCGLSGVSDAELRERTGAELEFFAIDDHVSAVQADVERLVAKDYLSPIGLIAGMIFDVETGRVEEVTRWQRPG